MVDLTPTPITRGEVPARAIGSRHKAITRLMTHGTECSKRVAVATRRKDNNYRHIEIFDIESKTFYPVTKHSNPNIHHYNPFVSPDSSFVGYHRFRGESGDGESIIPHLSPVLSPIKGLRMLRLNGAFPAVSPAGELIAFNPDLGSNAGVDVVKSDGSKRWTLFKGRTSFCNSWSPSEKNVIFTSIGPIFESVKMTVQIAQVSFSLEDDLKPEIKFQPYGDLYVARLDGSERKRLTWNGYENGTPTWHPGVESEMGSVCLDGVGDR
nr:TolB protein-related protein [Tanacetum cinerariifolium]